MITVYDKIKDGCKWLSANFQVKEFACKCSRCAEVPVDDKLVGYLQKIREHFGASVEITSGYRCPEHNAEIPNAAKASRHMHGTAADFVVDGVAPAEVAKYAESIGALGIGLYENGDGDFVHIDTRDYKSFWYGHAQERRETFGGAVSWYRIRKSWDDEKSQVGAYASLEGAVKACPEGYKVYDQDGTQVWPEPVRTCTVTLPVLRMGDTGDSVKALQLLLIGKGYSCGKWDADGEFGADTDNALRCCQEDNDLTVDGIAGADTWGVLLGVEGG